MSTRQQRLLVQQVQEPVVTSLFVQTRPQIITGSILSRLDYTCVPDRISWVDPHNQSLFDRRADEKPVENHENASLFTEKTSDFNDSLFENLGTNESF